MDLRSRLARLEKAAKGLMPDPSRCPRCRAPIPSIPGVVYLGADGSIRAGAIVEEREPCPDCGGYGGRSAARYDPATGRLRGKLIVLWDDDPPEHGRAARDRGLDAWFDSYDGRPLGRPWDAWVAARGRRTGA